MPKKLRKAIAIVGIFNILYANIVYGVDIDPHTLTRGNVHLSPALKFGDLGDAHHKNLALAEMKLQLYLSTINALTDGGISGVDTIDGIRQALEKSEYISEESTGEDTARTHEPAQITLYFNQVEHVAHHIFAIPVSVTKRGTRSNYTFLFSTVKPTDSGYPVVGCHTLEEFDRQKAGIEAWARRDRVPERKKEDQSIIDRYIQQEINIDTALRHAHEKGFTAAPSAELFDYKERVLELLKVLNIKVTTPEGLTALEEREFFLVERDREVTSMISTVTVVDAAGKKQIVRPNAHSSNYAVHILVSPDYFDVLTGRVSDASADLVKETALENVEMKLAYEIGVMLGFPMLEEGKNIVSERYREYRNLDEHEKPEYLPAEIQATVADLDTTLATRDYAMAENETFPQGVYYFGISGIKPERKAGEASALPYLKHFLEEAARMNVPLAGVEMHGPDHELTEKSLPEVIALLNEYGMGIATISPEIFRDFDPAKGALSSMEIEDRQRAVSLVKRTIDLAVQAECPKVNLWPGLDLATEGERGERYKMLVDSVTECLEYAHKMGVMLTVEPVPLSKRGPAQPIIYDIDQAEDLYLELKNQDAPVENFGIVMDLSHQILADSSATSTSDVLDRQISGLAAWAKHLHEMGIAFWIHANDNYDFEAYVTGKAKAIQDADQDLNVGAEHAADIQALFAYLAEIGYEEIISFDLSPTTESVEGAVKRIRNNITTCDRLYQGERCLDILGKYEQLAQGAISQYQAARQTAQTGKAYALVSIILRTHGNEMRGYLEEGDIEEEKQAMLSELRGAEETDIEMALEMVNAIHIKKGLPANSILVGLCHMLELAKDGKPYDDVRLTMAEPFDLSVVNKYFHLAGETLKGYKGERGDTSETRIAEAMFYAYEKEVRGRLTEESKEQYRARLLKALSEGTSDDAKRAHQFLKDIGIIPFEIQPSKEPLFGQLRDMLNKAMIEIPPTAALLPDQGYYFTFADRGTHYTARSRTRRNAFIDFITRTLAADEIEYLIDTVEERSEQTLYDAETIARLPRLYTILMRLKVALDILDVRHDLPRSLPGKHGLCGTSTLKTALALKRTIEPLPETWVTGEAVDGASFLQLPDERLREMALLEMSAARALLRTHTSRPGFMPASAWKHVPAFAKIMWLGRVRDEHHAMHFTHNFRRATRLRAGVYAVPCMVVRSSKEVLYYAVIFQSGGEQHLFIVTADEMAGMKACQGFGISGVERNAKDSQAMNRYLLHEAGVDAVIHYAHEKGLAKKPAESRFNYRNTVLALQEMLALRIANPGGLTTLEERECYLVKMTGEVRSLMTKTPRARLVDRDGQEHDVHYSEHASNRYVHVFVDEETFDLFTDESAVVEGGVLENRISSIIEPSVVHAIGVMLGLPVTVTDGREIRNVLDERYAEIPLRGAAPFPALEAEIVDLRNTLRTRDYAMEGSPDPLLLGSLGHESLDYKRIALTQRALKEDLAHLHALDAIEGATSLEIVRHAFDENARLNGPQAYNEETIYEPATIEAHFNDVEHVGEHIFSVPLHIGKGGLDTEYRLLFLTKKEEGIYPSVICTERGYALKREAMIEQDALPHRREREEGALHRYLSVNEAVIDTWIREKMQEGDTYIELGRDADDEANERFLDAIHDISYPDEYPDIGKLDRELFDRKIDDILAKVLHERRIILIKVKRGEARPVIRERDKDITVTSHSSQNALYLFLDEMDPTMRKVHLFENLRSYFTSGVFPERTGVRVDGLISSSGASNIADREIAPKLIHEIGVICDMNYDVTKDGRVTNDMDRLYAAAKDVVTRAKHHIPRDLVARVSKGLEAVANLDANLVRRDYAGGETEKSRYLSLTAEATEDLISNLYSKDEDVAGSAHELLTLALLQDASRVVTNTVTSRIMSRVRALGKEEAVTAQVFLKKCSRGDYLLFSLGIERTLSLIRFRQALLRETHFASAFPLARQILAKGPARRDYEKACVLFALMMKCEMMPQLGHAAVEPEAGEAGRALAQAEADTRVMQEIGLKAVNKLLNENDASAHLLLSSMLGSRDTERGWRGVLENALERENRIAQAIGTIRSTSTTETEKKGAYRLLLLACEYGVGLKEIHKKETPLLHGPLSSHISSVHPALAGMAQRFLLAYHDRVKGREAGRRLVTETIANTSGALLANLSKENDAVADDARALLSLALAEKSGKTEEGVRARIRQELAGQVYVKQEKPSLRLLTLGLAYDIERENIEKTIDNTYQHAFEAGTLLAGFCITPYLFGEKELPGTDSFGHEGKKVQKALDQLSKAVTGIASVHEDYEVSGRGGPRRIIEVPYEVKKTRDAYWMITMLVSHATNEKNVREMQKRIDFETLTGRVAQYFGYKDHLMRVRAYRLLRTWYGVPQDVMTVYRRIDPGSVLGAYNVLGMTQLNSDPLLTQGDESIRRYAGDLARTVFGAFIRSQKRVIFGNPLTGEELGEYRSELLGLLSRQSGREEACRRAQDALKNVAATGCGDPVVTWLCKIIDEAAKGGEPAAVQLENAERIDFGSVLGAYNVLGRARLGEIFKEKPDKWAEHIASLVFDTFIRAQKKQWHGNPMLPSEFDSCRRVMLGLLQGDHDRKVSAAYAGLALGEVLATKGAGDPVVHWLEAMIDAFIHDGDPAKITLLAEEPGTGITITEPARTAGRRRQPGRSPEDAWRVILRAQATRDALKSDAYFTMNVYEAAYRQAASSLGLPSEVPSRSTIGRDLEGLIILGYVTKEKKGKENRYSLTEEAQKRFGATDTPTKKRNDEDILTVIVLSEHLQEKLRSDDPSFTARDYLIGDAEVAGRYPQLGLERLSIDSTSFVDATLGTMCAKTNLYFTRSQKSRQLARYYTTQRARSEMAALQERLAATVLTLEDLGMGAWILKNIDAILAEIDTMPIVATERDAEVRARLQDALLELKGIVQHNPDVLTSPKRIGAFSETKQGERRAGITPDVIRVLYLLGLDTTVQSGIGVAGELGGSRFDDTHYKDAGAHYAGTARDVFELADIVQHIKELQDEPDEYALAETAVHTKGRQVIFNFNHFAQSLERLKHSLRTGATFVSFENVRSGYRKPILEGPSEKAGVVSAYMMALYLKNWRVGTKIKIDAGDLQKIENAIAEYDKTNVPPIPDINLSAYKTVIEGGVVGYNEARILARMGASVAVIEKSRDRIAWLQAEFSKEGLTVETIESTDGANVLRALKEAHGISTTAYVMGKRAQPLISKDTLRKIGDGKVFTVVDIDQGGGVEGVHATSHAEPVYEEDGNLYYCVANIPGAVPRQTSTDISLAAFKYLAVMALYGMEKAVEICPELAYAVDASDGRITNPILQDEFPDIDRSMALVTEREKMSPLEEALAEAREAIRRATEDASGLNVHDMWEAIGHAPVIRDAFENRGGFTVDEYRTAYAQCATVFGFPAELPSLDACRAGLERVALMGRIKEQNVRSEWRYFLTSAGRGDYQHHQDRLRDSLIESYAVAAFADITKEEREDVADLLMANGIVGAHYVTLKAIVGMVRAACAERDSLYHVSYGRGTAGSIEKITLYYPPGKRSTRVIELKKSDGDTWAIDEKEYETTAVRAQIGQRRGVKPLDEIIDEIPEIAAVRMRLEGEEMIRETVAKALSMIPYDYTRNGMNHRSLRAACTKAAAPDGEDAAISEPRADLSKMDEHSALIFSEKVTFDNGLGVLLPKLVQSGIQVAVVATTESQRKAIEELNKRIPGEDTITCAESVPGVISQLTGTRRYYYYKVEGDPEADIRSVTTFDITGIVKEIIEALGHACGIVHEDVLEQMHRAARTFAEAA